MKSYLQLLQTILSDGVDSEDRTGTGTRSIFGYQIRFPLHIGFPLLTTKKVNFKAIVYELLWFLQGDSNIRYLHDHKVHIWDAWASKEGELGPIYGVQWRKWKDNRGQLHDQIQTTIDNIRTHPESRRHIVSAWNVGELTYMALPPCHILYQWYIRNGQLSCQLYQRSGDVFLGVPFNIASYSLLTHMMAQILHLKVGDFILTLGDAHLYHNHLEAAQLQLTRTPYALPTITLDSAVHNIDHFSFDSFALHNYTAHPHIKVPIAV